MFVEITQQEANRIVQALTKDWDDWSEEEEKEMRADYALAKKFMPVVLPE